MTASVIESSWTVGICGILEIVDRQMVMEPVRSMAVSIELIQIISTGSEAPVNKAFINAVVYISKAKLYLLTKHCSSNLVYTVHLIRSQDNQRANTASTVGWVHM